MIPILYLHEHVQISGGETSLLLLWEHLDRQRFQPILLAPAFGPLIERARRLGVPTYFAGIPRFRDLLTPRGWDFLAAIENRARHVGAQVLHGNTPHSNLAAAWAGRRLPCRVVWHERTLPESEWDADRWLRFLPDRIICNSAAVARRLGGPSDRVVIIHNGVPLQLFYPGCGGLALRRELGVGPDQVAVGMVGNFSPLKRHELFLRAAAMVAPDLHHAHFLVIGSEVFPENRGRDAALRAESRRLGLNGRVSFLGSRDDMPEVMDALDILVSACEVEACSRAILEAMASGTPVIASDAGGNPELVVPDETGLLFPPGDAKGLARALHKVIQGAPLRKTMGDAARARAQARFSIERQVRETEVAYDATLANREDNPGRAN